jgi:hypothetical protein
MKKTLFFASILVLAACSPSTQKEAEPLRMAKAAADSTVPIPVQACNCELLQNEVDSLKAELSSFKKKRKKSDTARENDRPAEKVKKKDITAVVGKRDSDGSIQCSYLTNGVRCKKRTFAKNGLCFLHGADADVK